MTEAAMFAIPVGPAVQLGVEPRLASWNRAGDPDQVKLEAFWPPLSNCCARGASS